MCFSFSMSQFTRNPYCNNDYCGKRIRQPYRIKILFKVSPVS